jgi:transcriptional regulator with XRE-family HTH domain
VSTLFLTNSLASEAGADNLSSSVPKHAAPKAPKFGAWLELQRGQGRSLEQIAQKIRPWVEPLGVKASRSTLQRYEKTGRVPEWLMLLALSRAYGVPIEETVSQLVSAMEFEEPAARDLLRHVRTTQPPDAETSLRKQLAAAEDERNTYKTIIEEAGALAVQLGGVLRGEGGAAPAAPAGGRRHHRTNR